MDGFTFLKKSPCFRILSMAACVMMLVWWCILYPELCFPEDTYEIVYTPGCGEDIYADADEGSRDIYAGVDEGSRDIYEDMDEYNREAENILQAEDEQIIIQSRLFKWLSRIKE